jgi:hypothetical protein
MGGGVWDNTTYTSNVRAARAAGKSTFDHSDQIRAGRKTASVHELLNPLAVAGPLSPFAGKVMREVTISDEHPRPTPIAVMLDVTGSNYGAAVAVHSKLPQLFGLLQRKGYVEDPQILVGAIGDAHSDQVPLQVGQFESDNRIDTMLEAMYLEGNGGGQARETYEVGAYFLARHTYLESWHKQGRKGYAIFIGDELPYDMVRRNYPKNYFSDNHTLKSLTGDELEDDVSTVQIFKELQEQYEVFFLFQQQGMYRAENVLPEWRKLIGENAVVLADPNTVCEFIAGLLAIREGGLDLDEVEADMLDVGVDPKAIKSVGKTLARVGGGSGGAVAKTDGTLDIGNGTGADRL